MVNLLIILATIGFTIDFWVGIHKYRNGLDGKYDSLEAAIYFVALCILLK